jgi:SAM-dependent methyltransferase
MQDTLQTPRSASVRRLGELDWDFPTEMSVSPFSDLHWHPSRFPSQVPAVVIGRFTAPCDAVLDPFMGSGTTLTEAQRLGRASTGVDINPIACLMARAKTLPYPSQEVLRFATSVKTAVFTRWDEMAPKATPIGVQKDKWYTSATQRDLERLWGYIHADGTPFDALLRASFSAVLMPACRETRHWGYVCDNSQPKSNRERDVRALFCDTLDRLAKAYAWRETYGAFPFGSCEVLEGDATQVLKTLPDNSFGCFVTSPPYFGVTDYVKSQRLSLEWFEREIEPSRLKEIGARSKRHRLTALVDYINELASAFSQVYRVLKKDGWGVILYGQSPSRASAKAEFVGRLEGIGFRIELEKLRQITEMRRQVPSLRDEHVLLVRKP